MPTVESANRSDDPADVAIIGMACTFPGARSVSQFWENIVNKVDAVTEVTPDRWDPEVFYDPDPAVEDRLYCKKGGWIGGTFAFNPLRYGVMPSTIAGAEPDHFLVLRTVDEALADAGYANRSLDGERVSVILGKGNYLGPGVTGLMYRGIVTEQTLAVIKGLHPEMSASDLAAIKKTLRSTVTKVNAEVAPGLIPNICTGRVANRLDFMGRNFTVDAACASSLIATELGLQGLRSGQDDLVLVGGVHIFAQIPFLQVFDAMRAVSLTSTIRPFDEHADGTICGEGIGVLVLKRLADAERDGDRIYALVKGVSSASDGRAKSVTAPRLEGEELALRRTYDACGVAPETVGLIEAHGTGTPVGDAVEIEALRRVFGPPADGQPPHALGSVKSMIGHAMTAAGAAGLIKAALALYQGVLPPTLNCDTPRESVTGPDSPFYVNTETRPWIHGAGGAPRRAGVNAFGFGGINAHAVLEEYRGARVRDESMVRAWDSEVVFVDGDTRPSLVAAIDRLRTYAVNARGVELRDVASTLNTAQRTATHRLAVVASSFEDLTQKLDLARTRLDDPACAQIKDRNGIYYLSGAVEAGKVAVLLPGEGSQHVNMLSELCVHFPDVRRAFDLANSTTIAPGRPPAGAIVYPPPFVSAADSSAAADRLWSIDRATEAILAADAAVFSLIERLGVVPDMMAGYSAGEWIAMAAAGMVGRDEFFGSLANLAAIHRRLDEDATIPRMCMLAVAAGRDVVEAMARDLHAEVAFANDNCAHQVVIVVSPADERVVVDELRRRGVFVEKLPFERGYHSPSFACIIEPLREHFSRMNISAARIPLYSCTTARPYPGETNEIIDLLSGMFARPLLFRQTVEAMYEDGARIFIEAGPRANLTAFVDDILRGRPHLAVAIDQTHRTGLLALNHAIGILASAGVPLDLEWIYKRRAARTLTFDVAADHVDEDSAPGMVRVSICYPRLQVPLPAAEYESIAAGGESAIARTAVAAAAGAANGNGHVAGPGAANGNGHAAGPGAANGNGQAAAASAGNGNGHAAAAYDLVATPAAAHLPWTRALDPSILEQHTALMEAFLSTQEAVMTGYFGAAAGTARPRPSAVPPPLVAAPAATIAERPSRREPPPLEKPREPEVAVAVPEPAAVDSVATLLLRIVSDRTGYPVDMLGLDLDLEADLGIDSIKRVEILSALAQATNGADTASDARLEEMGKLKTLRQILAFIEEAAAGAPAADRRSPAAAAAPAFGPLLRSARIVEEAAGESLTIECTIAADEHLYLRDHCLYYPAPGSDGGLVSMPMTCALEIMAEAASLLHPGAKVVGVKGLQALRWINFERPAFTTTVSIAARRVDAGSVRVAIRSAGGEGGPRNMRETHAEATILFADRYPDPPAPIDAALTRPQLPVCSGLDVYSSHMMFHGPSFQGLTSLSAVAEDGVLGRVTVLPNDRVLASNPAPRFHIDPFLLDAAGQVAGYWPSEYLREGHVVLPIGLAELTLYGDAFPAGLSGECRARIRDVTRRRFRADLDVLGADGRPLMRIVGWEDWRFYWDAHIYQFWRFPDRNANGVRIDIPGEPDLECRRVVAMTEMDNSNLWESLWMHMILTPAEIDEGRRVADPEARRTWMFRRAAAKDVVRMWVLRHAGRQLCPTDVEIVDDGNGTVRVHGRWTSELAATPHVAVATSINGAVAVASGAPVVLRLSADGDGSDGGGSPAPGRWRRVRDGDETIAIGDEHSLIAETAATAETTP